MERPLPTPMAKKRAGAAGPRLLERWWLLMDCRIGIVPLPIFIAVLGVVFAYVARGEVPSDITTNIAVLAVGGFGCAEIGKRLPGLRRVGAAAILATFIPSLLVHLHVIPQPLQGSITQFTEQSNFLYLFIGAVIVGSIMGMERHMLIGGFLKILVPILAGSLVAVLTGCLVGTLLGLGLEHTFFKIVVPVMAGGVGEGAIPLSIGYATLTGQPEGALFAEILPVVMFGSLTAILFAGGLNLLGKKYPHLTGEGQLQREDPEFHEVAPVSTHVEPNLQVIGGALVMAMTLYLIGDLFQDMTGFPGPVTMLLLALVTKLARLASPLIERAAFRNYQFFAGVVTYPLLFAIGVAKTPWNALMKAFTLPTIITVVATVVALPATGLIVARFVGLFPVETAIIAACRASQGGTGDVAILGASNRMTMMPFAQVATRIGGAATVTLALALLAGWR